jgi:hypothetical protein
LVELETAQKRKTKVTIAASETKNNNVKVERKANCRKVEVVADAAVDVWYCAALRRDQLIDHGFGSILPEVRLDSVPNGRTSLTAVSSTKRTGPSGKS